MINGQTYTLTRHFTNAGRVLDITYPSGLTVKYDRTTVCACSVKGVDTTYQGSTETILDNLLYRLFGGATNMDTSAGDTVENQYDLSARLTAINPGGLMEQSCVFSASMLE